MPVFGVRMFDEFTPSEMGAVSLGVIGGSVGHMFLESVFDGFYEPRFPENYPVYSTLSTTAIMAIIAGLAYWFGRKPDARWLQYVAGGLAFVELVQILDLIRIQFFVK